jgi:acyl-CoA thioester hydrolase
VKIEIRVAWGEMDAYGHVNNAVFMRWFESARVEWFEAVQFPEEDGKSGPVLRTASIEYLVPVTYPDTITVSVAPTRSDARL